MLGKVLIFILPLVFTNLLQTFYNAADMIVVGMSSEPDSVGAIGMTAPFVNMVVNVFMGFSVGANVMVARHIGAKDDDAVSRTVHTAIAMSLIFGIGGVALGLSTARPVLRMMGATGKLLELAVTYTCIVFIGIPFLSLTNYCISIFRAKGDTRTPLIVLSATGVLNVLLNLFFVMVVDLSVEGVAIATMCANAASAVILLFILRRDTGACRFSFRRLRIDRYAFRNILYIGVPAGIQGALFSLSNIIIQSSIIRVNNLVAPAGSAYQPIVKGNAAATNLEAFAYTATNSVHQAAVTFTSQNLGAKKPRRIYRVMGVCFLVTTVISLIFSSVFFLFYDPLIALYGIKAGAEGSLESIATSAAYQRLYCVLLLYAPLAWMEVGGGVVRGLGKSLTSTVISLIGACLLRIVWILTVFEHYQTLLSIYISYPVSWLLTAMCQFAVCFFVLRRLLHGKPQRSL
ncbi:MAG: MATE family efflux transporter [Clostridia bacterium]|nr:MATE family efflux transporter [Clostridia bacterium]